jgi:nucleoside-diphosphate kinase
LDPRTSHEVFGHRRNHIALLPNVGEIISRFERKGFQLKGLKLYQTPKAVAEEHYKDLASKPFYPALVGYIISGPVVCMVGEH